LIQAGSYVKPPLRNLARWNREHGRRRHIASAAAWRAFPSLAMTYI
jgi:hypothetical protein